MLIKYRWNAAECGPAVCGLYAVRMEAAYKPAGRESGADGGDLHVE